MDDNNDLADLTADERALLATVDALLVHPDVDVECPSRLVAHGDVIGDQPVLECRGLRARRRVVEDHVAILEQAFLNDVGAFRWPR